MPVEYTFGTTVRTNNGSVTVPGVRVSGDAELVFDDMIPAGAVNRHIVMGLDVSELKGYVIVAEGLATGKTMTVKTNSTSSPVDTLTLTPASPGVSWYAGAAYANPLSADVTAFYVSNDDTTARRFRVYACADITPGS